jgi:PleD family two-component response regulator
MKVGYNKFPKRPVSLWEGNRLKGHPSFPAERMTEETTMTASILVVEDDIAMRDGVREVLETAGYRVSVANNGQEALRVLDDANPELIVSDIMMP